MNNPFFSAQSAAPEAPVATPTRAGLAPSAYAPMNGGMGGMPSAPTTTSLDLPPTLAGLIGQGGQPTINQQAIGNIPMGTTATNPNAPALDIRLQPTYAQGGMVGPNGMPEMGGMPTGAPAGLNPQQMGKPQRMTPEIMEMKIQEFMRNNPQEIAEFKQVVQQLISTGELTPDELNMMEQLATTALQNPDLYPKMRQFAIQQGLATEQDIAPEYDEGLVYIIVLVARAMKANSPAPQPEPRNYSEGGVVTPHDDGSEGGAVKGPGTGTSDSVPIRVSSGEYIIPAHVVKMKGVEFFDSLLAKYNEE